MRAPGPPPAGAGAGAATPTVDLARTTAAMTVLTLVSRVTGLVRVLVVAAVLGTTFLGNTYQSANTVPNLLFELFAAGALQAVMIPAMVELFDRGDEAEASRVAGSLLGLALAGLAVVAAVGMLAAPWVMRVLVAGVESPEVRAAQIRLGTILLWFFLPQLVLYAAGMVATGVLNARGRFTAPVAAPVANNIVVIASYGVFWLLRGGAAPGLDLTPAQIGVLGLGTTLGVLALSALPVLAVVRSGFPLRPRLDHRHPEVRRIVRRSGWAAVFLGSTQMLLGVVLVLANGVEGGVVAYQVAYTIFLLPHALFALPVLTTLFPALARRASAGDHPGFANAVAAGVRAIAYFVLPAAAALAALSSPLTRVLLFGESAGDGAVVVAEAVVAFAPGLLGYGAFLFLTRALYAVGDTRTPSLVHVGVVVGAALAMAGISAIAGADRVPGLAAAHSLAYLVGAVVLARRVPLRARLAQGTMPSLLRPVAGGVAAAIAAGGVMWLVQQPFDIAGRIGALAVLAGAGVAGAAVYLGAQALLGTRPATIAGLLRSHG
ncbi:MAG TPA: murein biosynthesis integral membrane protein MurJ [Acidimicrobiales bacterium]|nr:murein biosynthesis integral membrane protein MurJ [Acidimicrobiales bacterium]